MGHKPQEHKDEGEVEVTEPTKFGVTAPDYDQFDNSEVKGQYLDLSDDQESQEGDKE